MKITSNQTLYAQYSKNEYTFTVTAQYHGFTTNDIDGNKVTIWYCGFGTVSDGSDNNIKIGSITPQEIDGFKIMDLQDIGISYLDPSTGTVNSFGVANLSANRKCILHIKGKNYRLTHDKYGDGNYYALAGDTENPVSEIGIKDKEQLKVTCTLL